MTPLRSIGRQDDQPANDSRAPTEPLDDDPGSQPDLLVDLAEGRLDGYQLCLDLDDEERARGEVPAHQVDGAPLAILGVRQLGDDVPAPARERSCDGADEGSVAFIEEPRDDPAPPRDLEPRGGIKGVEDHSHGLQWRGIDLAALEGRDGRLAHACTVGQVPLTPASTPAQELDGPAYRQVVHGGSIATASLPALTSDLPGTFAGAWQRAWLARARWRGAAARANRGALPGTFEGAWCGGARESAQGKRPRGTRGGGDPPRFAFRPHDDSGRRSSQRLSNRANDGRLSARRIRTESDRGGDQHGDRHRHQG